MLQEEGNDRSIVSQISNGPTTPKRSGGDGAVLDLLVASSSDRLGVCVDLQFFLHLGAIGLNLS